MWGWRCAGWNYEGKRDDDRGGGGAAVGKCSAESGDIGRTNGGDEWEGRRRDGGMGGGRVEVDERA